MRHGTARKPLAIGKKPLQPCVTIEQIYAFEPGKPETYTPSPLMNAILEAMCVVCPLSSRTLGKYLDADPRKLTSAVFLLTGMEYAEMREKWGKNRIERMREKHPDWTQEQLVRAAGYAAPSSVWRTEHRYKRKQEYREILAWRNESEEEKIRYEVWLYKKYPEILERRKASGDQSEFFKKVLKAMEEEEQNK